mmetsp:Transcript_9114/g.24428  ORF Transcript_9114/g.24428 Transcript_9114/m.24428 type:complete len:280 (-) Transcript_9114:801-1640(-)
MAGRGNRWSSTCVPPRRPRTKRLSALPHSVSHWMPFGSFHSPTATPCLESKACTVPERCRRATTKPAGSTCSEPGPTPRVRCSIARSGTRRRSPEKAVRSCTIRPEVVPTTTQPTRSGWKVLTLLCPSALRHSLLTATEFTYSRCLPPLPSQSLEIFQVAAGSAGTITGSTPNSSTPSPSTSPRASAMSWPPTFVGRGHSASFRPRPWSTTTWQESNVPGEQTTLMSFKAWPSRAEQGGTCSKLTVPVWSAPASCNPLATTAEDAALATSAASRTRRPA